MLTTTLTHSSTAPSTLRSVLLGCLISGAALLAAVAQAPAAILLSEYDDSLTNLVSGAPNGTAVGGVSMIPGKIGSNALSFDGDSGYVDATNDGFPNSTAGLYTGSASFWLKTTSSDVGYILQGASGGTQETFFGLRVNQASEGGQVGNMSTWLRATNTWPQHMYRVGMNTATNSWRDGDWHHVTMTWNATTGLTGTGSASIYLDGLGVALSTPVYNSITSSDTFLAYTTSLRIGAGVNGAGASSGFYTGALDDVAVWDGRLTATEALSIYNLGNDTALNYNAFDANTLFGIFASQGSGATTDGKTWQYVTGLTGTAGSVLNHDTLVLDGAGNGVQIVPEPSSLALLLFGALGLGLVRRKRS